MAFKTCAAGSTLACAILLLLRENQWLYLRDITLVPKQFRCLPLKRHKNDISLANFVHFGEQGNPTEVSYSGTYRSSNGSSKAGFATF